MVPDTRIFETFHRKMRVAPPKTVPPEHIPITSPLRIETTREKCLLLVAAKLEAIGKVSVI